MVAKPAARRKASISPARERSKSTSPPPQTRILPASSKPSVTQFQSKGARNEMELSFDRYCALDKSSQTDGVTGRGLTQFLSEIAVSPLSLEYYVVVWKVGATQRGCITRSEWVVAMYAHGIETLSQLKLKAAEWAKEVRGSGGSFLLMYNFVYDYIRGEEDRRMSLANATKAWDVFFEKHDRYARWRLWAADHVRPDVSRDLWRQVGVLFILDAQGKQSDRESRTATALPTVIAEFLKQEPAAG